MRRIAPRGQGGLRPQEPGNSLLATFRDWLTSGNLAAKVGVVLSLFGTAFLVKEAIDRSWLVVPIEVRLMGIALFGMTLLAIGWRLHERRPSYAVSLQGGGIAVLFLTIYAAFALYGLLPVGLAFGLLVLVTAAAGTLAVLQDARVLAVLGLVGGFLTPVLVSSSAGDHVALFSYYAILNLAVVSIAWFKSWRELNVLGFLFTFVIGSLWGYAAYRPEHFATTEPFLVLFVLMYTVIPTLFASRQVPELRGFVDGTLVFGTPIVGFGLQSQLVAGSEFGLAISAVVWAGLYIALAAYLHARRSPELRVLTEAFLSLGMVFLAVAVPLAFDADVTSVAWALQGAAMIWLGRRQQRPLALFAGVLLQLGAAVTYVLQGPADDGVAILNGTYLGALSIALAGWFSSRVFDALPESSDPRQARVAAGLAFFWGTAWWIAAGLTEIDRFVPTGAELAATLLFAAASTLAAIAIGRRWPRFNLNGLLMVAAMVYVLAASIGRLSHPLAGLAGLAWPVALLAHFIFLRRRETQFRALAASLHTLGFWLVAGLLCLETHWWAGPAGIDAWPLAAALSAVAALVLATVGLSRRVDWPLGAHESSYVAVGGGGALALVAVVTLGNQLLSPALPSPLPYVPILNPLELVTLFVFLATVSWYRRSVSIHPRLELESRSLAAVLASLGLVFLTSVVARSVHHFAGVPFELASLLESTVLQAALSIVWGSAALIGMIVGARCGRRVVWTAGALLMGVVVLKLFLVELDNTGTLARIVSFLGVGVLLLVVGYFAPAPPRSVEEAVAR